MIRYFVDNKIKVPDYPLYHQPEDTEEIIEAELGTAYTGPNVC